MTSPHPSPARRGSLMKKLPRSFYIRPTIIVAKDLLGKYLVRKYKGKLLIGKIVEVEAYLGEKDPASHAYRGKTKRNEVMFWEGGHLYVYFTYGMHFCANVVTEEKDKGRAVLLRAVEPIEGTGTMLKNRRLNKGMGRMGETVSLTNGPAKFCEAFAIKREQNGTDLLSDEIYIAKNEQITAHHIKATSRIGVTNGAAKKWRFYIEENQYVSRR